MKIRFARCSPITVFCTLKGLQYQLHHCQLLFLHSTYIHMSPPESLPLASPTGSPHNHLCSLIGTTQQATTPHFLRGALFHPKTTLGPKPRRVYTLPSNTPLDPKRQRQPCLGAPPFDAKAGFRPPPFSGIYIYVCIFIYIIRTIHMFLVYICSG